MEPHTGSSKTPNDFSKAPDGTGRSSWVEHAIGKPDKLDRYVLRLSLDEPREHARLEGDVVDALVDTSTWQYAVISVRSEPDERLVIAYPDAETLRDLIAAPSIVTLGYSSRADALKNIDRCVSSTASLKRLLKTPVLHRNMTFLNECRAALRRLAGGFGISGPSQLMRNLLHSGLAVALVSLYSRNILSSAVRAFVSF